MIDVETKKPLRVWAEETNWPYIILPLSKLDDLCQVLDRHQIRYAVDDDVISLDDGPETALVNISRGTYGAAVQEVLDKAN